MRPIQAERGTSPATTRVAPVQGVERGTSIAPTVIRPVHASTRGTSPTTTSVHPIRSVFRPTVSPTAARYIPYDRGLTRVGSTVRAVTIPENNGPRMMVALRGQQANDAARAKAETTRPQKPDVDLNSGRLRLANATIRKNTLKANHSSAVALPNVPQPQVPFPRTVAARLYRAAQVL